MWHMSMMMCWYICMDRVYEMMWYMCMMMWHMSMMICWYICNLWIHVCSTHVPPARPRTHFFFLICGLQHSAAGVVYERAHELGARCVLGRWYVYVYIYIYTHTHTHTCMYKYAFVYVYVCACVCVCICVCVCMCVYVYMCVYMCVLCYPHHRPPLK